MRPCPFCGSINIGIMHLTDKYSGMYYATYAYCRTCEAQGPVVDEIDDKSAIKAWESRA